MLKASSVLAAVSTVTLLVGVLEYLNADLLLLDLEAFVIDGATLTNWSICFLASAFVNSLLEFNFNINSFCFVYTSKLFSILASTPIPFSSAKVCPVSTFTILFKFIPAAEILTTK